MLDFMKDRIYDEARVKDFEEETGTLISDKDEDWYPSNFNHDARYCMQFSHPVGTECPCSLQDECDHDEWS